MTRDMESAHRETLPAMRAGAVDLAEDMRGKRRAEAGQSADPGRRRFLLGAGGVAAGLALAACSSNKKGSSTKGSAAPSASVVRREQVHR